MTYRKKLIEVALPLDAINRESAREKSIRHGHPSTLHLWWARRPLAACRAVIFASLVDDPEQEGVPQELLDAIDALPAPPEGAADAAGSLRRAKLFRLIEELVLWENTTNEPLFEMARGVIRAATGGNPPPLLDPFCGGGSIPLEGQRLGLQVYASDLNPVAVLITKALVEIPPKFAGRAPVNPEARQQMGKDATWKGAAGLAADVRYYGKWMRDEAWKRIGHLYHQGPKGETIIAWLWARTVKCPNPACGAQMPLVRSFWLSTKKGRDAWVEPIVDKWAKTVRFEVRTGKGTPRPGTVSKKEYNGAICLFCEQRATFDDIRNAARQLGLGQIPMAIVAEGVRQRVYFPVDEDLVPDVPEPAWKPEFGLEGKAAADVPLYSMNTYADLFTPRQLVALTTFCDLVQEGRARVLKDSGGDDGYADAVATYLAFGLSRLANRASTICIWNTGGEKIEQTFMRQAIPMTWDFVESNPFSRSTGNWEDSLEFVTECLETGPLGQPAGNTAQLDTSKTLLDTGQAPLIATDPPYYDNIGYADLSDFFYVWLRRSIGGIHTGLFSTVLTPKQPELVATPYRFEGDKAKADIHFEEGLARSFTLFREKQHSEYPLTLYYAFKQQEVGEKGVVGVLPTSTGWQKMLQGLVSARFQVTGTWPLRTERTGGVRDYNSNVLASSVLLACRPRPEDAPIATRREFLAALRRELPRELMVLMGGRVAPVDLTQAAIGPGMAVFSRYSKVLEADGSPMAIRTALQEINYVIEDVLAQQEGDLDVESQFCVNWYAEFGAGWGEYGRAETLVTAKNLSVEGLARRGLVEAAYGKVRLTLRGGYEDGWDPGQQDRLTAWESCERLVWTLKEHGEQETGRLARRMGGLADQAKDLAYRLYGIADRKGWAEEALGYNALVASWPEIQRKAAEYAEETQARFV